MAARPSKYAHVVGGLPKLPGVEPERQDIVRTVQEEILASISDSDPHNAGPHAASLINEADSCLSNAIALLKRIAAGKESAAGIAEGFHAVRVTLDRIDAWKSSMQLLLDAYEQLMLDRMEREEVKSLGLLSGASVSTYVEPYGKVVDKVAFRRWCVDNGYEAQLQLWPGTMNSITKERLLAGAPTPTGVEVFAKTMVRLNKA